MATNTPLAVSNLVQQKTGLSVEVRDPNDPVEKEYEKVLLEDDAALAEINQWREQVDQAGERKDDVEDSLLRSRIVRRAEPVRKSYESFLGKHPKHTNARVAYAAFLGEIGEETESGGQLEKAVEFDGRNPAALNNLANYYGHRGGVKIGRAHV